MHALWPHQRRGIDRFLALKHDGPVCITSPTGGGKSLMIIELIRMFESATLYTNRKLLTGQMIDDLEAAGMFFGVRAAAYKDRLRLGAPIQISSMQTEERRVYKQKKWQLTKPKLVLVDECHMQARGEAEKIIRQHHADGAAVVGLTATPIDIHHLYKHLVVAGLNSELRATNPPAHLLCRTYEPGTLDLSKIKTGEFTDGDVVKEVWTPAIFGHVLEHYARLNPEQLPCVCRCPSVDTAVWMSEQFTSNGIQAASLDGEEIVLNGERIPSDEDARRELMRRFDAGEIKVITFRDVLREAWNFPRLYHLILASPIGSLATYLQVVGRLLRAHPTLDHVCVARGTKILTDKGEVCVEDVTNEHRVWDGVEFVTHGGAVCNGVRKVMTWDGLTATPDHKVLTDHGWTTLEQAAGDGRRITQSSFCGQPVRVSDDSDPHSDGIEGQAPGGGGLQRLRFANDGHVSQDRPIHAAGLCDVHATLWPSLPGVDLPQGSASMEAVQRSENDLFRAVRRTWNQVPVPGCLRSDVLDCCEPGRAGGPIADARQDREQRSLRAGQSAMGDGLNTNGQSRSVYTPQFAVAEVQGGIPVCDIRPHVCGRSLSQGPDGAADSGSVECEVWDIVNCGPRHRYSASGVIVANCLQDHGSNYLRHGSPNADRDWQDLWRMAPEVITGERIEKMREKEKSEPVVCPQCKMSRNGGMTCYGCGYVSPRKTREIIQSDGTLKEVEGDVFKPRLIRQKPDTERIWEQCFFRCLKSGRTFNQARALFFCENYYYPPNNLPRMPKHTRDWWAKCNTPGVPLIQRSEAGAA